MAKHSDIDHTGVTGVPDLSAHTGDTSDAHDASAISVLDTAANFTGTDVEAVLAELQDNIDAVGGGSGITPWVLAPENGLANVGTATIGSANAGYVVPATLYVPATINGMIIRVTAQSGNISVALYDSSFARLATSGSVACPAVGHAEVNFTAPYVAAAGRYYLGISGSSGTAAFAISGSTGTNASPIHGFTMASAHPLPDPFVNGGAARSYAIAGLINGGWTG